MDYTITITSPNNVATTEKVDSPVGAIRKVLRIMNGMGISNKELLEEIVLSSLLFDEKNSRINHIIKFIKAMHNPDGFKFVID